MARGCRRGWLRAFLSDGASPVPTSVSILPALAIVGVRWPTQANWWHCAFIWLWWQIYQMERCSKPLRCYLSRTTTSGNAFLSDTLSFWWKQKIESVWCGVPGRNGCWSESIGAIGPSFWLWWQIYQMEGFSKPLRFYASRTTTSGNAFLSDTLSFWQKQKKASDVESLAEIFAGRGHQISRHFRWCWGHLTSAMKV